MACAARSLSVGGDDDALAGGEPVVLDDVRGAEGVERLVDLVGVVQTYARAVGHARRGHDVLGEGLGALELRGLLARGRSTAMPALPHGVGDTGDQRGLRADDDQIGAEPLRQLGDGRAVQGVDRVQLGDAAMPALPGAQCSAVTSGSRGRARHRACSRAPAPMTRTFTARHPRGCVSVAAVTTSPEDAGALHRLDPELLDLVLGYVRERVSMPDVPLDQGVGAEPLRRALAGLLQETPRNPADVLTIYADHLATTVISCDSPRYLAFIPAAPSKASLLFDMVVSAASLQGI